MTAYEQTRQDLSAKPRTWLVTGVAGFIGSHLLENLLQLNQRVIGLDNFVTGKKRNLEAVKRATDPAHWSRFTLLSGDIQDAGLCAQACEGVDFVLHQAALGSVPRSLVDPVRSNESNVTGFLNLLVAARDAEVKRFVYASSSSVYGDEPGLPKVESKIGRPLSPYAVTKLVNELYAGVFARSYGIQTTGLRYLNVFGPRQDPNGPYAAVIPLWVKALLKKQAVRINGDGSTSRDFCYVANVVQANLLAATTTNSEAANQVYNVALNARTSLNELFELLQKRLARLNPGLRILKPVRQPFRAGDVQHSQADVSLARRLLGYAPTHTVEQGLDASLAWYVKHMA